MSVETSSFVPDAQESGCKVVDICDDDNAGVACAAQYLGSPV